MRISTFSISQRIELYISIYIWKKHEAYTDVYEYVPIYLYQWINKSRHMGSQNGLSRYQSVYPGPLGEQLYRHMANVITAEALPPHFTKLSAVMALAMCDPLIHYETDSEDIIVFSWTDFGCCCTNYIIQNNWALRVKEDDILDIPKRP